MKYILQITLFIFLNIAHAEDYIVEIQASIKTIKETPYLKLKNLEAMN